MEKNDYNTMEKNDYDTMEKNDYDHFVDIEDPVPSKMSNNKSYNPLQGRLVIRWESRQRAPVLPWKPSPVIFYIKCSVLLLTSLAFLSLPGILLLPYPLTPS